MSILQILISFVLGSGLFSIHIFLRKLSSRFRNFDNKISEKEQDIIDKIFVFYDKISKVVVIRILNNEYGYIAVANKEISRVYAAAPPVPAALELIPSLLPTIFDELTDLNFYFSRADIQKYISEKLIEKAEKYPNLFTFSWENIGKFERKLKFEIFRFYQNILRDDEVAGKVEPCLAAARVALSHKIVDLDAIGSLDDEPLSNLLKCEKIAQETAVLNSLSDDEKARLLADFDDKLRFENYNLFPDEVQNV